MAATNPFYLQEGATLNEEGGMVTGLIPALKETFTITRGPYSMAMELNGLSQTGDWYQVFVQSFWPGCPTSLSFGYEVWNNLGVSVIGPVCNPPTPLIAGDIVVLGLSLNCAAGGQGTACLSFQDNTTGGSGFLTVQQPDPTATGFQNLNMASDANGFYSGPMTEVIDSGTTACKQYPAMPVESYILEAGGLSVSSYLPWSDEFGTGLFSKLCYAFTGPLTQVLPSPVSVDLEATGGSMYGQHWEAGQNWSEVTPLASAWRFQTDVLPLSFSIAAARTSIDVGQVINVTGSHVGGISPYECEWFVNTVVQPSRSCAWLASIPVEGVGTIAGYVIDANRDYAANSLSFLVYPALVVPPPNLSRSALDLGQNATMSANPSGGFGPYAFRWEGLPPACTGFLSGLTCSPSAVGGFAIRIAVTDVNGNEIRSSPSELSVTADPTLRLTANPRSLLLGQAILLSATILGGLGPFTYGWVGLPPGCYGLFGAANGSCTPAAVGTYNISIHVVDANGFVLASNTAVTVDPSFLGLPAILGYGLTSGIAVALAAAGILARVWVRRRHPPQGNPPR